MAFEDILNPNLPRLNLAGVQGIALYFEQSRVTSNPSIKKVASSDIFSSAKPYYTIELTAGIRYTFAIFGNTTINSTVIANADLQPVVLNSEINDGTTANQWDFFNDFIPITTGRYYIQPKWLTTTGAVIVYEYITEPKVLQGSSAIDSLLGGEGNDTINGFGGNDLIVGAGGNDTIDGGSGVDTAKYVGNFTNFAVKKNANGFTVTDKSGTEGVDSLQGVERIHFGNTGLALDTNGISGQAYRLYQAAFNRAPDVDGLGFWIKQMDTGVSLANVAAEFSTSAEFKAQYGANPSNLQIVEKFYQNVLHRAGEVTGVVYWSNILDTKAATVADVLTGFSESPENQAALVGVMENGFQYTIFG